MSKQPPTRKSLFQPPVPSPVSYNSEEQTLRKRTVDELPQEELLEMNQKMISN